ncbi:hypothetical protein K2X05_05915 [bacterium]|nr:hypothetical protein [bacterium]
MSQSIPVANQMSSIGLGAFIVNFICSVLLVKYRDHNDGVVKAAFLSARNDLLSNIGIIGAGLVTAYWWSSFWPDLIVGIVIFCLNFAAAKEVWEAAKKKLPEAKA